MIDDSTRRRGGWRDKAVALAVLIAAAAGYQAIAVVWLRPPPMQVASTAGRKIAASDDSLADLFEPHDWQRARCMRLKTADGTLLFQHWKPTEGLGWKLWPVTIVLGRGLDGDGGGDDQPPILIDAPGGAQIEFNGSLDVFSGVAPSIRRGQMIGPVHLHRLPPATSQSHYGAVADRASGRDHAIDLTTANVGIDAARIWTTEPIALTLGRARFVGRDLTLHLAQGADLAAAAGPAAPATGDPPADVTSIRRSPLAGTLDRLELVYLDEVVLPVGEGPEAGEVSLTCGGTTEFDFALDKLSLRDTITLTHRVGAADVKGSMLPPPPFGGSPFGGSLGESEPPPDRLVCQSLDLTLRDPLSRTRPRPFASDWIDRVEAAGRPMRIDAPSRGLTIVAGGLVFDPVLGVARIDTAAPDADHPTSSIRIDRQIDGQEIHAELARLEYRFDPAAPNQVGTLEVVGGGMVSAQSPGSPFEQFSWRQSLRATPTATSTTEAPEVPIEVAALGNVSLHLAQGGHFQTDSLEAWVAPREGFTEQGKSTTLWRPQKIDATGNVDALASGVTLQTHRLRLFFEHLTAARPPAAGGSPVATAAVATAAVATAVPITRQPQPLPRTPTPEAPTGLPPSEFAAAEVSAKLTLAGTQLRAMDVSARGRVAAQTSVQFAAGVGRSPVRLSGQTLRLARGTANDYVHLAGDPGGQPTAGRDDPRRARIDVADGFLVGERIDVNLTGNRITIDSPGEVRMPVAIAPAPPGGGTWRVAPRLRFGHSMVFDGQTLRLLGGIDLNAQTTGLTADDRLRIVGQELAMVLTGPVRLDRWLPQPGQTPPPAAPAAIEHVTLSPAAGDRLNLVADRVAADGLRLSQSQLRTGPLRWTPGPVSGGSSPTAPGADFLAGGQVVATGGGRFTGWFAADGGPLPKLQGDLGGPGGGGIAAGEMVESRGENQPTAIDLVYRGDLTGTLTSRQMTIAGGVNALQRSVSRIGEPIDVQRPGPPVTGDVTLVCERIGLAADPAAPAGRPAPWEVTADGAVRLRSHSEETIYQVDAARCSYTAAKDLLTIAGGATQPAQFAGLDRFGQRKMGMAADYLMLDIATMNISDMQMRDATVATPPELIRGRTW